MSEQVSAALIKETQDALSKYVKKPPLTEKFLKKPPFRYLHDIVTAVIKETGFLDGLFTTEELDSNNVKDKESKIIFLNKLISFIKNATGKNISVRSGKIVAGLEVHKTLELLQLMGKAIDEKVHTEKLLTESVDAKSTNLQGNKNGDETNKKREEVVTKQISKESRKVEEKLNVTKQSSNQPLIKKDDDRRQNATSKSDKLKKGISAAENVSVSVAKGTKTVPHTELRSRIPAKPAVRRNVVPSKSTPTRRLSLKESNRSVINSAKPSESAIKEEKEESSDAIQTKNNGVPEYDTKIETKNVQKNNEYASRNEEENSIPNQTRENDTYTGTEKKKHARDAPKEAEKPEKSSLKRRESASMPRPGSARPGSRKLVRDGEPNKTAPENLLKENSEMNGDETKSRIPSSIRPRTANRPASARPGAPRIRDRGEVSAVEESNSTVAPVNVIEEGKQDQFVDDKDSFIVIETDKSQLQSNEMINVNESEQGQLVHQILKTQKELNESVVADDSSQNMQLKIEWEAGRQAEKNIVSEEIEKIRSSIQVLTSAANPLGKLFDFLQEDVDEMQRELQHWKNVNEKLQKQQTSELELGKMLLQPLQKQLSDTENCIEEEYLQIANIKMSILNSDEKILKLATNNNLKIRTKLN